MRYETRYDSENIIGFSESRIWEIGGTVPKNVATYSTQ
jgi:hypothetical protein